MNREALDAFFADAEDVLTDWRGSYDSMDTTDVEPNAEPEDALSPEQVDAIVTAMANIGPALQRFMVSFNTAVLNMGKALNEFAARFAKPRVAAAPAVQAKLGHAFTPNYDLACTVQGCGLGPEEH